jgi:hypothetical protein
MKQPVKQPDFLDRWQYQIFRWVLFIISLWVMFELLDSHIHILRFVSGMVGR